MRRKWLQAQDEAKKLERSLAKELGDGTEVESVQTEGWRGRAQQIIMLKTKVKRLEASLAAAGGDQGSVVSNMTNDMHTIQTYQSRRTKADDVDSKAAADLSAMQSGRQQV